MKKNTAKNTQAVLLRFSSLAKKSKKQAFANYLSQRLLDLRMLLARTISDSLILRARSSFLSWSKTA